LSRITVKSLPGANGERLSECSFADSLNIFIPGIFRVLIKVIVVHGELRERIPDGSGRP